MFSQPDVLKRHSRNNATRFSFVGNISNVIRIYLKCPWKKFIEQKKHFSKFFWQCITILSCHSVTRKKLTVTKIASTTTLAVCVFQIVLAQDEQ